jgi:hypothetical protein
MDLAVASRFIGCPAQAARHLALGRKGTIPRRLRKKCELVNKRSSSRQMSRPLADRSGSRIRENSAEQPPLNSHEFSYEEQTSAKSHDFCISRPLWVQ